MSTTRTLAKVMGVAAASGTTLALAGAPGIAAADDQATVLKQAYSATVDTFNPFISIYLTPTGINRLVYENLVQYSAKDSSPTQGLATDWKATDGGRTWTFHIRKGMKWSDGEPITSADPQWTYTEMMNDPDMAVANGSLVTNFESVEAPDDHTLVIHMKQPQASNPGLEIPVVPKHVWSKLKHPEKYDNAKDVVGSGPFVLESYKPEQSVVLKANPNFWKGKPKVDGVTYVSYKTMDAAVQALRSGEVDVVGDLTVPQFQALKGKSGITTNSGAQRRFSALAMNPGARTQDGTPIGNGNPVLKDPVVRRAIRQAIDIPELMDKVLQGHGTRATSFIPAVYPTWHWDADESQLAGHDPAAANAALDKAGYQKGPDGIRLDKQGNPIVLDLMVLGDEPLEKQEADFIIPWLKQIGLKVKMDVTDGDAAAVRTQSGKYDLYFTGWSQGSDPDYQLGINTCDALPTKTNGSDSTTQDFWCDKQFDKLYAQQHAELDPQKRQSIVQQMQQIHYKSAPEVDFWYPDRLEAYRSDRFTNLTTQPAKGGIITAQSGYWSMYGATPVKDPASSNSGGLGAGAWSGIGVAAVVLVGGGAFLATRRKKTVDERE